MNFVLIIAGITLIVYGVYLDKGEKSFTEVLRKAANADNKLNTGSDIADNIVMDLTKRVIELETRLSFLEKKDGIDFNSDSVDDIVEKTGMRKGEVLLLKRFSKKQQ